MDKVGGLVPVVYYDLIARIPAGAIFLVALIMATTGMESLGKIPEWTLGVLFFLLSYLIGYLLTTISALLGFILWTPPVLRIISRSLRRPLPTSSANAAFAELYRRIDEIGKERGGEQPILIKMEASAALADNLLAGYVGLVLIVPRFRGYFVEHWPVGVVVLLFFVATILVRRLILIFRQDELYDLIFGKERQAGGADSGAC